MYMRNIIIVVLMALLFCIGTAFASSKAEYEKRASLLAEFLHTGGRVTVAHSLGKFKINDASLAEKVLPLHTLPKSLTANIKRAQASTLQQGQEMSIKRP